MKKYNILILMFTVYLILSCKQSFLEVEDISYKKEGIYCLVYPNQQQTTVKVQYASLDSLNHFKDTGILVPVGYYFSFPDMTYNSKNDLLLIASSDYLYFYDAKTNKLIKEIYMVEEKNEAGMFWSYNVDFIDYNNDFCYLNLGQIIFKVNFKEMTTEIALDLRSEPSITQIEMSQDGRYLYLDTRLDFYERYRYKFYKGDLINKNYKLIDSLTVKELLYRRIAVSKDYAITIQEKELFKFDIKNDKLIEKKEINFRYMTYKGMGKNNSLYCIQTDFDINKLNQIHILNLDNYEIKHYMTINEIIGGTFNYYSDGLYFNNGYRNYFINLERKEKKYDFTNPNLTMRFLLKETKL